jgi:hypothetical protein
LHWADKQKPLREVAGEFSVFPASVKSPPLAPEATDETAPLPAKEITDIAAATTLVERIKISEHFMVVEYVPERRSRFETLALHPRSRRTRPQWLLTRFLRGRRRLLTTGNIFTRS